MSVHTVPPPPPCDWLNIPFSWTHGLIGDYVKEGNCRPLAHQKFRLKLKRYLYITYTSLSKGSFTGHWEKNLVGGKSKKIKITEKLPIILSLFSLWFWRIVGHSVLKTNSKFEILLLEWANFYLELTSLFSLSVTVWGTKFTKWKAKYNIYAYTAGSHIAYVFVSRRT